VLVRHLLEHSAGIPNPPPIRWVRPADAPEPDPSRFLSEPFAHVRRLGSPPGTRGRYSNLGYLLLGAVISAASGEPFREHVTNHILRPLGMHQTAFVLPPEPAMTATVTSERSPGREGSSPRCFPAGSSGRSRAGGSPSVRSS
jgi:CubicO group peptidase (beta-lactamase class C family)